MSTERNSATDRNTKTPTADQERKTETPTADQKRKTETPTAEHKHKTETPTAEHKGTKTPEAHTKQQPTADKSRSTKPAEEGPTSGGMGSRGSQGS